MLSYSQFAILCLSHLAFFIMGFAIAVNHDFKEHDKEQ